MECGKQGSDNSVLGHQFPFKKVEDIVTSRLNRKMAIQLIREVDVIYNDWVLKRVVNPDNHQGIKRELLSLILDNEIENVNFKIEFGSFDNLVNMFFSERLDDIKFLMSKYESYVHSPESE